MTLTELKYVIAVARERHFGRAAESCFVSQPSLSVAVKKLEEELGVSIFERRSNDIAVTPVGSLIIDQARKVIEEAHRITEIAHQGQDPLSGPVRLGVIYTIGPYLLPDLISRMTETTPQMPLILEEGFTTELLQKLRNGQIDVAITADTLVDTGFMTEELYEENFVVAVPSHHPWVNRSYIGTDELKDQTMLLLGAGHCFRDQILGGRPDLARFNLNATDVQKTVEGSSLQTIFHMVAQGLGITVLPASAIPYLTGLSNAIKILPFKNPPPTRKAMLVWRKSFTRMAAIEAIREATLSLKLNGCAPLPDSHPEMR